MAPIMSRKLSALPVPTLKMPLTARRIEQPAQHRDGVVDIDEIAALVAVGDAVAVRLEQPDRLAGLGVVEHLGQHARHVTLVIFVRAVDVEEFQARPMRRQFFFFHVAVGHRLVEQVLAPAVEIHRLELAQRRRRPVVVEALRAVAIGRGRGGIDERRARRRAPVEQAQRQAEIVLHHQVAVGRGGVGDGAHVDDGVELAAVEPAPSARPAAPSRRRWRLARLRHLASSCPSRSLTTMSLAPASLRLATTFDPMNPAPPVTRNMRHPLPASLPSAGAICRPQAAQKPQG